MSRKRELSLRLAGLTDIAGIMSAMKSLALMETRILGNSLQSLERMVAGIEAAASDFLSWHGEFVPAPGDGRELRVLVGSEQGFCGDFNEAVMNRARSLETSDPGLTRWIIVGRRLHAKLSGDPRAVLSVPGATVVDEVSAVLLRLSEEIHRLLTTEDMAGYGLCVLYNCDATSNIRLRRLLPLRELPVPARKHSHPAEIYLSPAEFLSGLIRHYLYATLNEALYSSLMAENRKRLAHMDRALQRLDEETTRLRLVYNAQRQEEIIEEIEILLLSAEVLAGE
jgi:F-type H+-transporting ATPase subunit gamma